MIRLHGLTSLYMPKPLYTSNIISRIINKVMWGSENSLSNFNRKFSSIASRYIISYCIVSHSHVFYITSTYIEIEIKLKWNGTWHCWNKIYIFILVEFVYLVYNIRVENNNWIVKEEEKEQEKAKDTNRKEKLIFLMHQSNKTLNDG